MQPLLTVPSLRLSVLDLPAQPPEFQITLTHHGSCYVGTLDNPERFIYSNIANYGVGSQTEMGHQTTSLLKA